MQTIEMGSDKVRLNWADTVDKAIAGNRIVVQRNRRPVASLVSNAWLDDVLKMAGIMERQLAAASRASQEMVDDPSLIVDEDEYQQILTKAGLNG